MTDLFQKSVRAIQACRDSAPQKPGCYRMLDEGKGVLYVGKARNLKKRLLAYTKPRKLSTRLQRMIAATHTVALVITETEAEALLMEASLIKSLKPRYNILLRDDKSFPSVLLRGDHRFPQIVKHRGAKKRKGFYFGPFASSAAVNDAVVELQKLFLLRTCSDSVFAHRTRPCLQYHIKRCSAPCVGRVSKDSYDRLVADARAFLEGKSENVRERLIADMQDASAARAFERALVIRERLAALKQVQARSAVSVERFEDADALALYREGNESCVEMFFFRRGRNCGNRAFFPRHGADVDSSEIVSSFAAQFYAAHEPPPVVLAYPLPSERAWLQKSLSHRRQAPVRVLGSRVARSMLALLAENARSSLERRLAERRRFLGALQALGARLEGAELKRVEVYDNSHTGAEHSRAAMVVVGVEGFCKAAYRTFSMKVAQRSADDYAMMREVLTRRWARLEDWGRPDLIVVDGGRGQLACAREVLQKYGEKSLPILAIAKGAGRKAGLETIYASVPSVSSIAQRLPFDARDPVFHFLLRIRDEAHRCAIGAHRAERARALRLSALDSIEGIGAVRKKRLLQHFGSIRAIADASRADLCLVPSLGQKAAACVYERFHNPS